MSRKKSAKGKAVTSSPSAGSPAGKGAGKTVRSSPGIVQMNGVVHPSRPSISNSSEFYDIAFKVMLVGDSGVGKTCLLVRFKDGAFLAGSFISTVGIDFRNKVLDIYHHMNPPHAFPTFIELVMSEEAWLTEIHEYAQQDVVLMLLGNKADATHERVVKREDGERLAKEFGVPFMETSARSGLNVELAFNGVAKELKHRSIKDPIEKFKLQEYVNKEMKTTGCCRS
ncbi:ras-related protein Rab-26 [Notothenia coriiceps]|uniref:Ras-related protein Rab-26 n=1 Tax=Notothenia coriiceps TaxID=8208 RepID=A0A6I9PLG2_9TELE|nr:PREDICTED: ras-related protein Rab-26 [Notothenia coriiceps]